jgi:hypothetical protein
MLARKDQSGRLVMAPSRSQYPKERFTPSSSFRFASRPLSRDRLENMSEDPIEGRCALKTSVAPRISTLEHEMEGAGLK